MDTSAPKATTPVELKAQIDEYLREEIATREATAMGLDRDDTIVRRRLRQKFEFLCQCDDAVVALKFRRQRPCP